MNVLSIQEILSIFVCLIFKKSRIYGMLIDGSCNLEKIPEEMVIILFVICKRYQFETCTFSGQQISEQNQ